MANKFTAGMKNVVEVLNQMWDAFAAGPYNAVPLTGGTMTGSLTTPLILTDKLGNYTGPVVLSSGAGQVRPDGDGTHTMGTGNFRWSVIYASSGTIATSDANEKDAFRPFSEAEVAVAKALAGIIGMYKWREAIARKGEDARWHAGPYAQQVVAVFSAHGLDAFEHGVACYDEWPEGAIEHPATPDRAAWTEITPAGSRYALRYDELNLWLARGFDARLAALEATAKE